MFRIRGIPIEINYSWILIFLLVTANLAAGWFPALLPGRPNYIYYAIGAAGAILLFLCVLAHELSHSVVAQLGGMEVHGIILHIFGGVSLIDEKKYTPALEFRVSVAGPILSILLGLFFYLMRKYIFAAEGSVAYAMLTYLYLINFMLAAFNLLPGFPLDGGRVLRSILAYWKHDLVTATRMASRAGVTVAFLMMAIGALSILRGNFGGFWTILIGIFLKEAADSSYRQVVIQSAFKQKWVEQIMQRNPVVVPPTLTIQELIDDYFWRYQYGSFPVGTAGSAVGIVTFSDVKKVPAADRANLRVSDVCHRMTPELRTRLDEPILDAFHKATHNGVGRLVVTDEEGRILGYLSLRDIARDFKMGLSQNSQ
ncbi:MAG TPA: site-2 protease family protein [Acidobacteriota bacterium]|nr:site-2 protease family protein [Acidobacteriota bacterium]